VQAGAGVCAQTYYIAGVGWNLGLVQDDMKHGTDCKWKTKKKPCPANGRAGPCNQNRVRNQFSLFELFLMTMTL
jgi:hypothetical protein